MFSLKDVQGFLKTMGYEWNFDVLFLGNKVKAKQNQDVASNYLSKTLIVKVNNKEKQLKVSINSYKFIIYTIKQNGIFAIEKEENHSKRWQEYIKQNNKMSLEK